MNWEWAMKRARQLSVLFQVRYRVHGVPTKLESTDGIPILWMYTYERVSPGAFDWTHNQ